MPPQTATAEVQTIANIAHKSIDPSPSNPRKSFAQASLDELAASIEEHGVFEPVTVRLHPTKKDRYELIIGERRWRATKIAKLDTVPCIVKEASDVEVLKLQIAENVQREDLHPLEEGAAFQELHEKHGVPVTSIADDIGKSETYVYGRITLCKLDPEGREVYLAGKLTAATALLLARVPAKLQAKALEDLTEGEEFGEAPMAGDSARDLIQKRFMLKLVDAPFDRDDADLVPKAGACLTCPKRTGRQVELFADIASPDMCTDPDCYREKSDAIWERTRAEAEAKGKSALSDAEAKKVFSGISMKHDSKYVDLKDKNWTDTKMRTWEQILGKNKPPVILARDEEGNVHELVLKEEAGLALKKAGGAAAKLAPTRQSADPYTVAMQRKAAIRRATADKALALLAAAAEKKGATIEVLRVIVAGLVREVWADRVKMIAGRRGLEEPKDKKTRARSNHDILDKAAREMSLGQLMGLAVELVASRDAYSVQGGSIGARDALPAACKELRVDWAKCEAEAKAEQAARDKAKKSKAPKAAKAKPAKKSKGGR